MAKVFWGVETKWIWTSSYPLVVMASKKKCFIMNSYLNSSATNITRQKIRRDQITRIHSWFLRTTKTTNHIPCFPPPSWTAQKEFKCNWTTTIVDNKQLGPQRFHTISKINNCLPYFEIVWLFDQKTDKNLTSILEWECEVSLSLSDTTRKNHNFDKTHDNHNNKDNRKRTARISFI